MRILIYKRTHNTDPEEGCFGSHDCMGRVRGYDFDAVIGIGANTTWAQSCEIDGRVSWIGVGPKRYIGPTEWRGPLLTFDHFIHLGKDGPDLVAVAPKIARRFYKRNAARYMLDSFDEAERGELDEIIRLADRAKPSHAVITATKKLCNARAKGKGNKRC